MTATSKAARVNVCGVSEDKWENGWCKKCRCGCEMTHDVIVDARAYAYADKHRLLTGCTWILFDIYNRLGNMRRPLKLPKYFRQAIFMDGAVYPTLQLFPENQVLQVVYDSTNGVFQAGDLVYKDEFGLNLVQEGLCLDAENCSESLQGALFRDTSHSVWEFRK